ncbi:kinase-like protein, partial [Wilcoxina mikolae CBS 423.85]
YTLTNRVLGNGSYGKVHLTWDKKNHNQVACKIVNMHGLTAGKSDEEKASDWKKALREVAILMGLSHPNVINIQEYFRTNARIYIFEELITHGDLFSFMATRDHCTLEEEEAMPIAWQLLKALEYLHQNGIVHRDLKVKNILCANRDISGRIVLTDFGTARPLKSYSRTLTAVGTVQFCAPEISAPSATGYTTAVDMWSLGVVIHGLLYGTHEELTWYLHQGNFRHLDVCNLSDLAKDFIKKLLCINPKKRMTAKEAMEHRWLSSHKEKLEALYQK